jgi:hypothetical protein
VNVPSTEPATASFLVESEVDLDGHDIILGRAEYVQKMGRDLVLAQADEGRRFGVGSLTLGYVRQLGPIASLSPGLGFVGSVNAVGVDLEPSYGSRFPIGGMVFFRLRPARMGPGMMAGMRHVQGRP